MEARFIQAANQFIETPSAKTGFAVIANSKQFILSQVSSWKYSNLPPSQKLIELMTEMFLILMEDFDPSKIQKPVGILAYLSLRLRRLTRPYKDKAMNFGLSSDFEDLGRINFTARKIETVDEIVKVVRATLINEKNEKTALLEFMFIHMFPELAWASRTIAQSFNIHPDKQREADKKRHQSFNKKLRLKLSKIGSANWKEILDWSFGERSHLAWKIIQISPADLGNSSTLLITKFEDIRDKISPKEKQDISCINIASSVLEKLKMNYKCNLQTEIHLNEETAGYGEEEDIISILLNSSFNISIHKVSNKVSDYSTPQNIDTLFDKASADMRTWLESFFKLDQVKKEKPIEQTKN